LNSIDFYGNALRLRTKTLKEKEMRRLMTIAAAAASIAGSAGIDGSAQAGYIPNAGLGVMTSGALPLAQVQFFWGGYNYCCMQRLEWTWLLLVGLPMAIRLRLGRRLCGGTVGAGVAATGMVAAGMVAAGMVAAGMVAAGTVAASTGVASTGAASMGAVAAKTPGISSQATGMQPAASGTPLLRHHERTRYTESLKV
jgi:hypothetical protein